MFGSLVHQGLLFGPQTIRFLLAFGKTNVGDYCTLQICAGYRLIVQFSKVYVAEILLNGAVRFWLGGAENYSFLQ